MRFYQDAITGGVTAVCPQCQFLGDLIDLVAKLWRVDDLAACYRLRELRLIECSSIDFTALLQLRTSHRKHVECGQRMWQAAMQPGLTDDARVPDVLRRLRLRTEVRYATAKDYCPKIFGCASKAELLLAKSTSEEVKRRKGRKVETYQAGLIIPFYDLVGRPVSFTVLSRELGDAKFTETNVPVGYSRYAEEGMAGHPEVLTNTQGCVLITPHIETAIRVWSRASLQHYYKLPLVVARKGTACWQLIGNRHKVVWAMSTHDFEAISLAAAIDAQLLVSNPKHYGLEDYVSRLDISKLHRRAIEDKRIWTAAIAGILRGLTHYDAVDYLSRLSLSDDELARLREDEPAVTDKVVSTLLSQKAEFCSISYRHGCIEQNDRGWFYVTSRRRELIANAATRIERITTYNAKQVASVVSHCEGKELAFQADYAELKRTFADTLSAQWLAAGKVFVSPRHWQANLHLISLQLHHPTTSVGVRHIGFQAEKKHWVTPTHYIRPGRIIQRRGVPEWLRLPGQLYPKWKYWRAEVAKLPPALLAGTLLAFNQLASDYQGVPRKAVLFSGAAALSAVNVLRQAIAAANESSGDDHSWIVIPTKQFVSGQLPKSSEIASVYANAGWMHSSDIQRWYGLFSGAHSIADHDSAFVVSQEQHAYVSSLLLYLLKHWRVDTLPMQFAMTVLKNICGEAVTTAASKTLLTEVDPALSLIMLLKEINVNVRPIFKTETGKTVGCVRPMDTQRDMFIPISVLQHAIRKMRLGYFEHVKVLQRLAASKYFNGFVTVGVDQGWLISKDFFEKTIANETLEIRKFSLRLVV